ncbi:hypothetical protein [Kitasatospora sp. NBC_00315]|uniref:hypothetical protein n=1 Tax=Kitasatospora sp. NBC_00315 TaxID=2975963 RepID=UPI00324F702E
MRGTLVGLVGSLAAAVLTLGLGIGAGGGPAGSGSVADDRPIVNSFPAHPGTGV